MICGLLPPPQVVQATATTPCTTEARASRCSASNMVAFLPTVGTVASPSSSRRRFAETRSCATECGVAIVDVELGSSTRLLVSRTGGSCGIIAVAAVILRTLFRRWPSHNLHLDELRDKL